MNVRILSAALSFLLFVVPLGAAICGNCAPVHCAMTGASEAPESSPTRHESRQHEMHQPEVHHLEDPQHGNPHFGNPQPQGPQPQVPQLQSHCAPAPEPKEEVAPCKDTALTLIASDCCAITLPPVSENAASLAGSVVFAFALEAAFDAARPAIAHDHTEHERQPLPRQALQALYTLHSAFLI